MLNVLLHILIGLLALLLGTFLIAYLWLLAWWWRRESLLWRRETEKGLEDKQAQEPDNPIGAMKLAELYRMRMGRSTGDTRQDQASKALLWYTQAYELRWDAQGKLALLENLARAALDTNAEDKAAQYATLLLDSVPRQPNYSTGSAIHVGNLILGRLALRRGDLTEAKDYLLRSGRTHGGPGLDTGGPSMMLAQELLEHGESEAVLQYLALCATFWKMDYGKLKLWTREVKQGRTPAFGKQLYR